jgi:hypothetical protein
MPLIPLAGWKTPRRAAQARNHQVAALLAPSNGLNYRDPFITLDAKDAVVLNNFIAKPTGVELRGGFQKHVTGLGGTVNTIMSYMSQDSTDDKLFAAVDDKFYDVTNSADAPTALVADTNSVDGLWSSIMFSAPTMNFLCATSPSGGYWTYDRIDGWEDRTAALTGLDAPAGCIAAWKNRLWICGEGTAKVFYLPVSSIQGAVTELDIGPLLKHGGSVVAVVNWTMSAGLTIDDYLVFFGSQGDVVVFQGTDPDNIDTFAIKGIWYMGRPPVGNRFFVQYGGELLVLSEFGLIPLSKMINGQVADSYNVMSARISPALTPMLSRLIDNKTWEVRLLENNDLLMIKPPREFSEYRQYVMFIQTGAWSTFSEMPLNTIATYNGQMYFGDEQGNVQIALSVKRDGMARDGTGGLTVSGQSQGGFNAFGSPANYKLFTMARPILIAAAQPSVQAQMNVEYTFNPIYASPSFVDRDNAEWDEGVWNTAQWAGSTNTYAAWVGLQNMGYYGSLRVSVKGDPGTVFVSSNVMYQPGGVM